MAKKIIVTNGEYKNRIFNAEIGKDCAYVTIRSGNKATVIEIPNGDFGVMDGEFPEAFNVGDTMFVPESRITLNPNEIQMAKGGIYEWEFPTLGNPTIIPPPGTPIPFYSKNEIDHIVGGNPPFLETWPNPGHPDDVENNVDKESNMWIKAIEKEMDQLRAENKALRERSRRKGEKNAKLSEDLDTMIQYSKEVDRDLKGSIEDNDKLKRKINELIDDLNDAQREAIRLSQTLQAVREDRDKYKHDNEFHINEIEKGNHYRAKLKHTIEELHRQIRDQKEKTIQETARANTAEKDLELFKRIAGRLSR